MIGRVHLFLVDTYGDWLGDFAEVFLVGDDAGIRELAGEVFVAGFELVEAIKHKGRQ